MLCVVLGTVYAYESPGGRARGHVLRMQVPRLYPELLNWNLWEWSLEICILIGALMIPLPANKETAALSEYKIFASLNRTWQSD